MTAHAHETDPDAVRAAVMEFFLATGNAARVQDIAKHLGWSLSKTRSVVERTGHLHEVAVEVPRYSKDYPGLGVIGYAKAKGFIPTRLDLRDLVLSLRAAKETP